MLGDCNSLDGVRSIAWLLIGCKFDGVFETEEPAALFALLVVFVNCRITEVGIKLALTTFFGAFALVLGMVTSG